MKIEMMLIPSRKNVRLNEKEIAAVALVRTRVAKLAEKSGLVAEKKSAWTKFQKGERSLPRLALDADTEIAMLIGFTITDHPAVTQVTEAEAKKQHIGFARGKVDMRHPEAVKVLEAAIAAIAQ